MIEHYPGQLPLRLYDPAIRRLSDSQIARAAEVDVIAAHVPSHSACWWGAACNLSRARLPPFPPPGMRRAGISSVPSFRIERFVARRPVTIGVGRLRAELYHVGAGAVLREPPS